jgi:hypothetical protein
MQIDSTKNRRAEIYFFEQTDMQMYRQKDGRTDRNTDGWTKSLSTDRQIYMERWTGGQTDAQDK